MLVNLLEREANRAGLYAVEVMEPIATDTADGFIPRGTILVIDPNLPLVGGKNVIVYLDGEFHVGKLALNTKETLELRPFHNPEANALTFTWDTIEYAHRITSMHLPD